MEKDFHLHPVGTMSVVYNYVPIPKSEGVSVLTGFSPCGATDDSTKGRKRSSTIPSTRSLHFTLFGAKQRKVEDSEDDLLADDKVTQESAPNSKSEVIKPDASAGSVSSSVLNSGRSTPMGTGVAIPPLLISSHSFDSDSGASGSGNPSAAAASSKATVNASSLAASATLQPQTVASNPSVAETKSHHQEKASPSGTNSNASNANVQQPQNPKPARPAPIDWSVMIMAALPIELQKQYTASVLGSKV